MKLLQITEYFPSSTQIDIHGGVELRNYYVDSYFAKKHRVTVFCTNEQNKSSFQLLNGILIYRLGLKRKYQAFGLELGTRLVFIINALFEGLKMDFDIVEGSGFLGWFAALPLSVIKRKKLIYVVPDILDENMVKTYFLSPLLMKLQGVFFKIGTPLIITISKTVKEKLERIGLSPQTISVIYCGVDLATIKKIKAKKNKYIISCVSRLVPYKRIKDLVNAFSIIVKKFPLMKLTIIGTGRENVRLRLQISKLHLKKQVSINEKIFGHRDVLVHVKKSCLFCLPSVYEGFGIATIEALALGVPAVIADIPVNREITSGKGVLLFKEKNSRDLAAQIIKLLGDNKLYKSLQNEAIGVAKNYSWQKAAKLTAETYENLCSY